MMNAVNTNLPFALCIDCLTKAHNSDCGPQAIVSNWPLEVSLSPAASGMGVTNSSAPLQDPLALASLVGV